MSASGEWAVASAGRTEERVDDKLGPLQRDAILAAVLWLIEAILHLLREDVQMKGGAVQMRERVYDGDK